jgi:hypothetical protein
LGVEGQLCDNCNTLEFRMALDEADLPAMIRRLDEICETYPVIGHAEPQGGEEAAP